MELIDVCFAKQNRRAYGGTSCKKLGITLKGTDYLVKFPGNLTDRNMKNVALKQSHGPLCEYLGSAIFRLCEVPAHTVLLGKWDGTIVALCMDFCSSTKSRLIEFREIKATSTIAFKDKNLEPSDGLMYNKLSEALTVIREHPFYRRLPDAESMFWKMFIVDAIIGNTDRNMGNWGLLDDGNTFRLAPIYDNGNCLNSKWDNAKMERFLKEPELLLAEAHRGKTCAFTDEAGKRLNPFHVISSGEHEECTTVLGEILTRCTTSSINALLDDVDLLTDTQRHFYKEVLRLRIEFLEECYAKRFE